MDFKGSADYGPLEFEMGIFNLLNSRSLAGVTINDKTITAGNTTTTSAGCLAGAPNSVQDFANRCNSLDQYSYQPSRSFQVTLKVHL